MWRKDTPKEEIDAHVDKMHVGIFRER